ncbi:12506_t:CDS:2 [Entrophospora sp. SA101]|nr:12506_t:CDS:2 [Entrophospora sp. SA101]
MSLCQKVIGQVYNDNPILHEKESRPLISKGPDQEWRFFCTCRTSNLNLEVVSLSTW